MNESHYLQQVNDPNDPYDKRQAFERNKAALMAGIDGDDKVQFVRLAGALLEVQELHAGVLAQCLKELKKITLILSQMSDFDIDDGDVS